MYHRTFHDPLDDERTHIEDTLRSELLVFTFEHLTPDCHCDGKICSKCRIKQCRRHFAPDKRKRDRLHGHCRNCRRKTRAAHRRAHPEVKRAIWHNDRARKKNIPATFTPQQWLDLKPLYGYRCLCCGKQEPDITLTVDHVVPLSKGGNNSISNLQPLCFSCNSSKQAKVIDYRTRWQS